MKKVLFGLCALVVLASCQGTTYSHDRKEEDKLIANFISRKGWNILEELPTDDSAWGEKDYYKVAGYDDLYFRLLHRGDSLRADSSVIDPVSVGTSINMRYKKYALTENPDTISMWSTLDSPYPTSFTYGRDAINACEGWHVAVGLMKYSGSECEILCPSKLGFEQDESDVVPYMYRLKMTISYK